MASPNSPQIELLKGRENYDVWKFAVEVYLEALGLWDCVTGEEKDAKKVKQCRAKIILLLDPINYVHVQTTTTAQETWESLQRAFEDNGLTRRVGLLRTLTTTRLENCASVEEYVTKIIQTAHKLSNIGFKVEDEWIGTILLAGLPKQYETMIMGIESSGIKVTGDAIKTKLLQDISKPKKEATALYTYGYGPQENKGPQKNAYKGPRCYNCNKYGHIAKDCKKKKNIVKNSEENVLYMALSASSPKNDNYYLDSGATAHFCKNKEIFTKKMNCEQLSITTANGDKIVTDLTGCLKLPVVLNNCESEVEIKNVYHVPELNTNLLSVSEIVKKGNTVEFSKKGAKIMNGNGKLIATASLEGSLFKLDVFEHKVFAATTKNLWHRRMGHLNARSMAKLSTLVDGMEYSEADDGICDTCQIGKSHRLPFQSSDTQTSNLLELVHSDVLGPIEEDSLGGSKYVLLFLDDFSHKSFLYFLESKDQVANKFNIFKNFVENQTNKKIKTLRSDNGGEYCNNAFKNIVESSGILHQTTCAYTSQQNGKAERYFRSLMDKARCLLTDANLPNKFWAEAVNTASYLLNRSPSKSIKSTPEEVWSGKKPNLSHVKVFGCKAYTHIPTQKRKKLDPRATPSIFVGYSLQTKGYRLYDPVKSVIQTSRDVTFSENENGSQILNSEQNNKKPFYVM